MKPDQPPLVPAWDDKAPEDKKKDALKKVLLSVLQDTLLARYKDDYSEAAMKALRIGRTNYRYLRHGRIDKFTLDDIFGMMFLLGVEHHYHYYPMPPDAGVSGPFTFVFADCGR